MKSLLPICLPLLAQKFKKPWWLAHRSFVLYSNQEMIVNKQCTSQQYMNGPQVTSAPKSLNLTKCQRMNCCCRTYSTDDDGIAEPLKDFFESEWSLLSDDLNHSADETVLVIQPHQPIDSKVLTTPQLQLEESIALVESLPNWKVVGRYMDVTKSPNSQLIFEKKEFSKLVHKVASMPKFTSLFVSVEKLTPLQKETYSKTFGVKKVFDRYALVLQIFRLRVRTKEAKLQVALAEMPYVKAMVTVKSTGDYQRRTVVGESYHERVNQEFLLKEKKLKKLLKSLKQNRDIHRRSRKKSGVPVVAVVGYTNAGKTSVIKTLAASQSLQPKNHLFATLDVTSHAAKLPNGLRYVLVDTVGFLSNLPHELFDAFSATMEDMLLADLIVHVRDASHPDRGNQLRNVLGILSKLKLESKLLTNIVEVRNKIDLVPTRYDAEGKIIRLPEVVWPRKSGKSVALKPGQIDLRPAVVCHASATLGVGMETLTQQIQELIMKITKRREVELLVPAQGDHLHWLREYCAVKSIDAEGDFQLRLLAILTNGQLQKFKALFNDVIVLKEHFSKERSDS